MAWLISLFLIFVQTAFAASTWPAPVSLTATDGVKLAAVAGVPSKATQGVVLVHMLGRSKEDWAEIAEGFYRQGVAVIALDLREHGANKTGATLTAEHYGAMPLDVQAATGWLRSQGVQRVALVGASIGANLALRVAADDPAIASVVLLSPGLDYKGLTTRDALQRYGARPILIVASSEDVYAATSARTLDSLATGEHRLEMYENAGHGTKMFSQQPSLGGTLIGFVTTHWDGVSRTTPSTQPLNIQIDTSAPKTSAPQ